MADLSSIRNNVRKMLVGEFGKVEEDASGSFIVRNESSVTFIDVSDWDHGGINIGCVEIYSIVVHGLKEVNKDLAVELTTDLSRRFGSWFFQKTDEGLYNLIFKNDLVASTLDSVELINTVLMVAIISNEEDDKIVRKYGGSVVITG